MRDDRADVKEIRSQLVITIVNRLVQDFNAGHKLDDCACLLQFLSVSLSPALSPFNSFPSQKNQATTRLESVPNSFDVF